MSYEIGLCHSPNSTNLMHFRHTCHPLGFKVSSPDSWGPLRWTRWPGGDVKLESSTAAQIENCMGSSSVTYSECWIWSSETRMQKERAIETIVGTDHMVDDW
jgi:hypothetical protein